MVQKDSEAADQRPVIIISWAAHKRAGADTGSEAEEFMQQMLLPETFMMTDQKPDLTNACRTQVEIELPSQSLALLRTQPLGNHLLMAPGKYADLLRLVCNYKGIRILKSN